MCFGFVIGFKEGVYRIIEERNFVKMYYYVLLLILFFLFKSFNIVKLNFYFL